MDMVTMTGFTACVCIAITWPDKPGFWIGGLIGILVVHIFGSD